MWTGSYLRLRRSKRNRAYEVRDTFLSCEVQKPQLRGDAGYAASGQSWTSMQERLAACAENLRKAVRYLANSSCTPQQKLIGMYNEGGFARICQDDLPEGFLKDDYLTIRDSLIKTDEPSSMAKIAA